MGSVCEGEARKEEPESFDKGCLSFPYKDVTTTFTRAPCTVEGEVPGWLAGDMYRQCGGAFVDGTNLLDGLAHVACWHLSADGITFSNQFLDSTHYRDFKASDGKVRNWAAVGTCGGSSAERFENLNVNFERSQEGAYPAGIELR